MSKVEDNKQKKYESILKSGLHLFLTKGISETSISDITKEAGVAKGTFYLYFKDKYSLKNHLITHCTAKLFHNAYISLSEHPEITGFEDKIIYLTDHIIEELEKNKALLLFISKNLSLGLFKHLMIVDIHEENMNGMQIFEKIAADCNITIKDYAIMMFMITELVSATAYSVIVKSTDIEKEDFMPYLNEAIRAIIRNHIVS